MREYSSFNTSPEATDYTESRFHRIRVGTLVSTQVNSHLFQFFPPRPLITLHTSDFKFFVFPHPLYVLCLSVNDCRPHRFDVREALLLKAIARANHGWYSTKLICNVGKTTDAYKIKV